MPTLKKIDSLTYLEAKAVCIKLRLKVIGIKHVDMKRDIKHLLKPSDEVDLDMKQVEVKKEIKHYIAPEMVEKEKEPVKKKVVKNSEPEKVKVVKPEKKTKEVVPGNKEKIAVVKVIKKVAEIPKEVNYEELVIETDKKIEAVTNHLISFQNEIADRKEQIESLKKESDKITGELVKLQFARTNYANGKNVREKYTDRSKIVFGTTIKAIVASDITKSDKVRSLALNGVSIANIAFLLKIKYSHVRNVLIPYVKKDK